MQELWLCKRLFRTRLRGMHEQACKSMGGVHRVCGLGRSRLVLVLRPEWKNGGTVEPPCDFQRCYINLPLNKGTPSGFFSRVAPLRARPCALTDVHKDCSWLVWNLNPNF